MEWQGTACMLPQQWTMHDYQVRCISPGLHGEQCVTVPRRPWSQSEQEMHINCLHGNVGSNSGNQIIHEAIASVPVHLYSGQSDSCIAINNMGGTVTPQLTELAKALWTWDIVLHNCRVAIFQELATNCVVARC